MIKENENRKVSIMNYTELVEKQKTFFYSQQTKDVAFRKQALRQLKSTIHLHLDELYDALYQDLGKSKEESFFTEIAMVQSEISYVLENLERWAKPKNVKTPIALFKATSKVYYDPYGVVLILSPWNYPFQLALNPLVGALAAGNTAILKPSSSTPHVAKVISKMLASVFPSEYVYTVLGNADQAEALLHEKVDYIFFTGSIPVGKKVMRIASEHLVPVTLELGGKSPAIIDKGMDLKLVAKRIAFGKLMNAGQTCIAPDYVLITPEDKPAFIRYFQEAVHAFYGEQPLENDAYPKIINSRHVQRLLGLIENEQVVLGGKNNGSKIEPTLVDHITFDSKIMQEEIFGPILPLITYQTMDEVIQVLQRKDKPLALYLFTNQTEVKEKILSHLSFGGGTINDTLMHFVNHHMGFGGVGYSGMGSYHGHQSFLTFSHAKSILDRSTKVDIEMRYHPFTELKVKLAKKVLK